MMDFLSPFLCLTTSDVAPQPLRVASWGAFDPVESFMHGFSLLNQGPLSQKLSPFNRPD